jgi:glycosyltransferase (activator-dependent family)
MRVLVVANPEKSTFLYLVPMAWALRTAGHEVHVASQPWFAGTITQAGLTAVPVGRDRDHWRVARLTPGLVERYRAGLPAPYDVVEADPATLTWERVAAGEAIGAQTVQDQNFPVVADLVGYARSWRPDLVIAEPLAQAGAIAARVCGAAYARMLFGVDVFALARQVFRRMHDARPGPRPTDPLAAWFAGYGRRYGFAFTESLVTGDFTIDQFPASLQLAADLSYVRCQYVPYGGPAVLPRWLWEPAARPRIGLTMGLTATEIYDGYTFSVAEVLAALADLDVEVVATVPAAEQAALGPVPDNVRLVSYVPWHALAPTCAAVIHHAGAATLATTSRHPVPQLALYYHFDQPILGRLLAAQGAGLALHTARATGPAVRDAVVRLLTEPAFRERAAALRDEIRSLPTPNDVVPRLVELTEKHRSA